MAKISKNRKAVLAKYDSEKEYSLEDAAKVLKEISFTKFDASVDLDIRLGVDPKKSDQMVRGVVSLPHGIGKVVRVLVLCTPDKVQEVTDAMNSVNKPYTNIVFSNADHGFFRDGSDAYNKNAATESWAITLAYFKNRLVEK